MSTTRTFFLKSFCAVITPYYVDALYRNKFFLTQKYLIEGLSARQIAAQIFSSKTTVLEGLQRFGIAIREPHNNHGNPSQPIFGKKIYNQRLVEDKTEQHIINVIIQLHNQGLSLRVIAKCLNQMALATKGNGKSWHPEMIRRILLRFETS